jgi:hypothetical protein
MSIEILRELTEAMEIASNGGGVNFYEYAKSGREAIAELEKREPAAWGMENDDGQIYDCITPEEHAREEGQYTVALYRGREWVGLTPEVIEQGCKESWVTKQAWESAVWWAEAKLKELNT